MHTILQHTHRIALGLAAALSFGWLGGCAHLPDAQDADPLPTLLGGRDVPAPAPETALPEPGAPLELPQAVRIAWAHSPRVSEILADWGLARADWIDTLQVANPSVSWGRKAPDGQPGKVTVEWAQPLGSLLLQPLRKRMGQRAFDLAQTRLTLELLQVAWDVEARWLAAIGAQQQYALQRCQAHTRALATELAQRFRDAGNIGSDALTEHKIKNAQARVELLRRWQERQERRAALQSALGLAGPFAWDLPTRLPAPVAEPGGLAALQDLAQRNDPALRLAGQRLELAHAAQRHARRWGWLSSIEVGGEIEREAGTLARGPHVELQLPLFHRGQAARAREQALVDKADAGRALHQIEQAQRIRLLSERLRAHRALIRLYRSWLLPLEGTLSQRLQAQQQFMLIGAFEVLDQQQERFERAQAYAQALDAYWQDRMELKRTVGGTLPGDARIDWTPHYAPKGAEDTDPTASDPYPSDASEEQALLICEQTIDHAQSASRGEERTETQP